MKKIGFIIPATEKIPAWYHDTIQRVAALQVSICLIRIQLPQAQPGPLTYRWFRKFEDWWFGSLHDAAEEIATGTLADVSETITVQGTNPFHLAAEQLEMLKARAFDMIYTIHFNLSKTENISRAAKYGLWHLQFGSPESLSGDPPAFWEVMEHRPVTGSMLLMRNNGTDTILYEGTTTTVPYSVKNNFNSIAWKSSSYLPYRLKEWLLQEHRFVSASWQPARQGPAMPGSGNMMFLFLRNVFRYIKSKSSKSTGRFTLLYAFEDLEPARLNAIRFKTLPLPEGRFFADPFLLQTPEASYIFLEEYSDANRKAHISVITIKDGSLSAPQPVLERPYHLSYPFVFSYAGEYYMVPETVANKTVELYRAVSFPYQWEFVMNLVENLELIDVTLHVENGRWWMFANSHHHPFVSTNDQLFIFHSDELLSSRWMPHPQNPVITNIANCRPAGRLFRHQGKLYRPAQNNASPQYGFGLKLNEVKVLNENSYQEEEITEIDAAALGLVACHHLDFLPGLVVIDGIPK